MSSDLIGTQVFGCIKDVKTYSEPIKKGFSSSNEKSKSIGILSEELSEAIEKAAQNQLSAVRTALMGFSTILARVEYSRKVLYQKINTLAPTIFLQPSQSVGPFAATLAKRDESIKKALSIPTTDVARASQVNAYRIAASALNTQTTQEARTWFVQYNADLKRSLREYALAQLEYSAKALEQWSVFLSDLAVIDFAKDTDEMISMLEQGAVMTTNPTV